MTEVMASVFQFLHFHFTLKNFQSLTSSDSFSIQQDSNSCWVRRPLLCLSPTIIILVLMELNFYQLMFCCHLYKCPYTLDGNIYFSFLSLDLFLICCFFCNAYTLFLSCTRRHCNHTKLSNVGRFYSFGSGLGIRFWVYL